MNADDVDVVTVTQGVYDKNLYMYCDNNPVMRVDEGGTWWDTFLDVVSLAGSIVEVISNPADPTAWMGLVGDTIDLIPFVSGVVETIKAVKIVDKAVDAADSVHDAAKKAEKLQKASDALQDSIVKSGRGFDSFPALKKEAPYPGKNNHLHHLVEQSQIKKSGFSSTLINNEMLLVPIDDKTHAKISGFYSSKPGFTGGLTVRDWLSTKSFADQLTFGLGAIYREVKGIK